MVERPLLVERELSLHSAIICMVLWPILIPLAAIVTLHRLLSGDIDATLIKLKR